MLKSSAPTKRVIHKLVTGTVKKVAITKSLVSMRGVLSSRLLAGAILAAIASSGAAAIGLDVTAIRSAQKIARGTEADRKLFHAPYLLPGTLDSISELEVITEFRRLVLLTEARLAAGDWTFASDARAAAAASQPWKDKVVVRARFRFHPHNIYTSPPPINIVIVQGAHAHQPLKLTADPQFSFGSGPPVLIGVVVDASFDAPVVGPRAVTVVLVGPGAARVHRPVDLGSLR